MQNELFVITAEEASKKANAAGLGNAILSMVYRAIDDAATEGARAVKIKIMENARCHVTMGFVSRSLQLNGYKNFVYDDVGNITISWD